MQAHFPEHRLVIEPRGENTSKESSKGSLKHSFSVNLRFNFWRLEYLFWRPKMNVGASWPQDFFLKVEHWTRLSENEILVQPVFDEYLNETLI